MPEVVAHQALDALARLVAGIAEHVRGSLLQLVAQHVLVALGLEMQDRADPQQKVLSLFEPPRIGGTALQKERIGQRRDRRAPPSDREARQAPPSRRARVDTASR